MVGRAPSKNKRRRTDVVDPAVAPTVEPVPPAPELTHSTSHSTSHSPEAMYSNGSSSIPLSNADSNPTSPLLAQPELSMISTATIDWPDFAPSASIDQFDDCNCDTIVSKSGSNNLDNNNEPMPIPDLASMDLPPDFDWSQPFDGNLPALPGFSVFPEEQQQQQQQPIAGERLTHSSVLHSDRCPAAMIDAPPDVRPDCPNPQHGKFQHVLHMVRVVAMLEGKMDEEHLSVDEALQFAKACQRTVLMVFELENHKFCKTCRVLAPTAMDLVLKLYEKAMEDSRSDPSTDSSKACPALNMGCFELEKADHPFIRDLIIARELQRSVHAVQTLSEWSRCEQSGKQCGTLRWYASIEKRLVQLMPQAVHPAISGMSG